MIFLALKLIQLLVAMALVQFPALMVLAQSPVPMVLVQYLAIILPILTPLVIMEQKPVLRKVLQ